MNDDQTFSINLNEDYLTSTGSEYTFNISDITSESTYSSILNNYIDPDRVKEMCEEYPALKKAWDNFYSIYKMVDQDYKGNFESKREI